MADIQPFLIKDGTQEYWVYIASKQTHQSIGNEPQNDQPQYRDLVPTVELEKVHNTIQGYAKYAIGAFKDFATADIEKITLKFSLTIAGKSCIPMLAEGSAEGNFEIQIECKFPQKSG